MPWSRLAESITSRERKGPAGCCFAQVGGGWSGFFAVVADGRQTNSDTRAVESDAVQKVFPITSTTGIFVISFCGAKGLTSIGTGEEINLPQLAMHCAKSLESRKTSNALGYIPCPTIANILFMSDGDQRLAAYRGPIKYANEITLQEAVDRSKALILAHSDPEAIAIDDGCRIVGGHIPIAAITPTEGFKWPIPPIGPNA